MKPKSVEFTLDELHVVLATEATRRLGLVSGRYYCELTVRTNSSGKVTSATVSVEDPRGIT